MNKIGGLRTAGLGMLALLAAAETAWAGPGGAKNPGGGIILLLGLGAGITAFMVWGRATFPRIADAAERVVRDNSAWRTFWIGLVNVVVAFLLVALFGKMGQAVPPMGLLALGVLAGVLVMAFRGGLGIWPDYGHRILGVDDPPSDLQATLTGGALLTGLLLLFPIGLAFFGYVLVRSLGAGMLLMVLPQQPHEPQGPHEPREPDEPQQPHEPRGPRKNSVGE